MNKLLFITNGHGEDLVAAEIIKNLADFEISCLPLVGRGKVFDQLNVKVLGPRKNLPSGGFSLRNLWFLAKDLYAGLIGNTAEHFKILQNLRGQIDLTVAIGDIVPILGALRAKAPFIFVGVNKSSYYKSFGSRYTLWEKQLLQTYAQKVFVRDKVTEHELKTRGIKVKSAEYAGNPLMDCVASYELPATSDKHETGTSCLPDGQAGTAKPVTIGFLPGTRDDAKLNVKDFERVAKEILKMRSKDEQAKFIIATNLENLPHNLVKKTFTEVLDQADIIIGLSGTGNEQAAGKGLPVISFYGRGSQYNKKFACAQKELLGQALALIPDNDPILVAAEAWALIRSPQKRKQMGATGKERMGSPGACTKIAQYIKENLQ